MPSPSHCEPDQTMPGRHVLISVLGMTPQILTETLYALICVKKIPISEVWVITTGAGRREVLDRLLDEKRGVFYQFCREYGLDPKDVGFSERSILVPVHDDMQPQDLRTEMDSRSFLEFIINLIRTRCEEEDVALHCSLAGGRKTMSVYLAFALQMFGRAQDKLYHVLVHPPEFENNPDFFYIPPEPRMLNRPGESPISSTQGRIDLIDIPFVRLRERVLPLFGAGTPAYPDLVRLTQQEVESDRPLPRLVFDCERNELCIDDKVVKLAPLEFALYLYYARRSVDRPDDVSSDDYDQYFEAKVGEYFPVESTRALIVLHESASAAKGTADRFRDSLGQPPQLPFDRVLQLISKINRKIKRVLGDAPWVGYYLISSVGGYWRRYGVKLDRGRIRIIHGNARDDSSG